MPKARSVLFNNTEQADRMLEHIWSTMEFYEGAMGPIGDDKHAYTVHIMALLKEAVENVRLLMDENMHVIINMEKDKLTA